MNKLSIVPADFAVYVDSVAVVGLGLSMVPADVHALQWMNNSGWIERIGQADEPITELPDWANQCVTMWNDVMNAPIPVIVLTDDQKKNNAKLQAMSLIQSSDWTMLPDVNLTNKADWTTYRAALRVIINNPQVDQVFPTLPPENWAQ
jgi:hypothetical protein